MGTTGGMQDELEDMIDPCYAEFSEHTSNVTQVRFSSSASILRAFSASIDKTFKVYDIPSKIVIKQIQV